MSQKPKLSAHCDSCDSENLTGTSIGCYFDVKTQMWVVGDSVDSIMCDDCQQYVEEVVWKEVKNNSGTSDRLDVFIGREAIHA